MIILFYILIYIILGMILTSIFYFLFRKYNVIKSDINKDEDYIFLLYLLMVVIILWPISLVIIVVMFSMKRIFSWIESKLKNGE